jgi:hypothetical protein
MEDERVTEGPVVAVNRSKYVLHGHMPFKCHLCGVIV